MYEQKMLFEQRFEFAKYSLFDLIEQIQTRKTVIVTLIQFYY